MATNLKKTTKTYTYAIGRRKCAVAAIKLFKGKGEMTVNKSAIDKYFPLSSDKIIYERPLVVTNTLGKYYYEARANGGGKHGQLEAVTLAVARALKKVNDKFGPILRTNGLLTVDSRIRERRMVGTGGKSRRMKQSPRR
ncbi:MAG TPA: 30S ribosomal protein S9 [Candidatus Woesebacteria bacterium]|nr:30S ribosomal protein S9 [Candidatus Woesebacteria bacterium]HRS22946.1 30S ribosomal protein S9 [Candidatus Woesebacteria bacterium]HRT39778.1 30S ribosomal protein S9 [Candidatus Woesebacteria bacterium]